jgi:hypothetical protein
MAASALPFAFAGILRHGSRSSLLCTGARPAAQFAREGR